MAQRRNGGDKEGRKKERGGEGVRIVKERGEEKREREGTGKFRMEKGEEES